MNIRPTRLFRTFLCLIVISFFLIISCSKDQDALLDAVLVEEEVIVAEEDDNFEDNVENENDERGSNDSNDDVALESRVTVFPVINDAYLQNGKGYDHDLVRLQENYRRSYLMFNLSEIDSIGGTITSANLEFVINTDDGNGTIKIYKGVSNDWTEKSLSEESAPEKAIELGQVQQAYQVGSKVDIDLDITELFAEFSTLILEHEDGDDLAFASKENTTAVGPKLKVTYDAPIDADILVIEDEQDTNEEETSEEDTADDDNTEEDSEEEDATDEDTNEDNTTEEDSSEEGTTGDDTNEEDNTEEDTTEEETNASPQAVIEVTQTSGVVPLEIDFNGSTSSDDKAIVAYEWNFNDGTIKSSTNVKHTFTKAGVYDVSLKVTDAEGLNSTSIVTITASEKDNAPPTARASANIVSGTAPLLVNFEGSESTDDTAVTSYSWNFKDGSSSNEANPQHTFVNPGTYLVELTVTDADGLVDKDTVTITVNAPTNQAPVAVASASITSGEAPLLVSFNGSNSSDDKGITNFNWSFPTNSSSDENTTYTFENPGIYQVALTVTDSEGLQDIETISITVTEKVDNDTCVTNGSHAGAEGLKTWCWTGALANDVNSAGGLDSFSNSQLAKSAHYDGGGIFTQNGRLNFSLNPTVPSPPSGSKYNYNYRSEIRDSPSNVNHPIGTEQWWGFDYRFGDDYTSDVMPWVLWQTHGSFSNPSSPMTSLQIGPANYAGTSSSQGELFIANSALSTGNTKLLPTGIIPRAGQTLKIVVHIVWGDNNNGLYQVWVDGVQVYNEQERTVYAERSIGGYWKIGIYKWRWQSQANVNTSATSGIRELNTSIGALRVIKKSTTNSTYSANEYNTVRPR